MRKNSDSSGMAQGGGAERRAFRRVRCDCPVVLSLPTKPIAHSRVGDDAAASVSGGRAADEPRANYGGDAAGTPSSAGPVVRTRDVSDGGCYVVVPAEAEVLGAEEWPTVELQLRIPRTTPNTYMLESVTTAAQLRRREKLGESKRASGLAFEFVRPLDLQLE